VQNSSYFRKITKFETMYRSHTCGELNISNIGSEVTLSGWVQRIRNLGGMTFVDLRDRYGITQLVFNMDANADLCLRARELGREYVVSVRGKVCERSNKNPKMPTGEIEIEVERLDLLNTSELPPFTIEDETDGGDELRMKYRYLDLRRGALQKNLYLRHRMASEVRFYLNSMDFMEVETPFLIKSTPEGARDYVVPSRLNPGEFYALPQSPQMFKQLLMISGYDKYYQIVKCFRDEDLRADRQPEFTQVDCEMSFVEQEDLLKTFEGLTKHLFMKLKGHEFSGPFPCTPYRQAIDSYGTDKPDIRFGMKIREITPAVKGEGFAIFDNAEYIGGICVRQGASFTRKETDQLTSFVKKPQIGAKGLVYVKFKEDGSVSSSVDKFFGEEKLKSLMDQFNAGTGDMLLILAGERRKTLKALGELRLEVAGRLGLRKDGEFAPLWVVDFPLLEWDDETQRYYSMHHPFTSPKDEDIPLLDTDPGNVRANAYDLVINGVEIGGGSVRIHNSQLQQKMFEILGFTPRQAREQFGFFMDALRYGTPPHGGIAFGFDRWVALFGGSESIRDYIAFPKNNAGRDVMINTPSPISQEQLKELKIKVEK